MNRTSGIGRKIGVPEAFAALQAKHNGAAGRAFVEQLPGRAREFAERWQLRVTGPAMCGMAALVLPVTQADGSRAALKLQLLDEESAGEPVALRRWGGDGAVRLLRHDGPTHTLLLERLDETRHLSQLADSREAVRILAGLLARLTAVPAPPGLRTLADTAHGLQERLPGALARVDGGTARVLRDCAAAVREVAAEPGDRLLHWDLHYDNVLAGDREPWLAIDPKPLAGDPGFDLMPALANNFTPTEARWRFHLLTETLGLDRGRAAAWTLGRVLQNLLWNVADGDPPDPVQVEIAGLFRGSRGTF